MGLLDIFSFWKRFRGPTWKIVDSVGAADEIPTDIPAYGAILVGTLRKPKWLAFDCPCNTGHRIMVTLDPRHRPHWKVTNAKKLTVWPSVDYRSSDRRCHYVMRRGRVLWVPEEKDY